MNVYGWQIDKDHISDGIGTRPRTGWQGPRHIHPVVAKALHEGRGRKFRLYDDDGILYYEGRYLGADDEDMFKPLEDFGEPDAGATRIDYERLAPDGGWATL